MTALVTRVGGAARAVRRGVLARRRLLAGVLAGVAVATGVRAAAAPPPPTTLVLVAAHDLPAGTLLEQRDLALVPFSPESVPAGTVSTAEGRLVAGPMRRGEPLTDRRLVGRGLATGYPGLVVVPVRIPDAGAVALLRVGDRIDLLATNPQGGRTGIVATGVPVLSLPDQQPETTATGLTGRLVLVGLPPAAVAPVTEAAVSRYVSFTYAG